MINRYTLPTIAQALTCLLIFIVTTCPPVRAEPINLLPFTGETQQEEPIILNRKDTSVASMEDYFPRVDYPFKMLQPVPLDGLRIKGLSRKAIRMLGLNYFVVVKNTPYKTMAEVYRENRLRGKSNFVTADSILHPYFAFTNRVLADTTSTYLKSDLKRLLVSMLESARSDYKKAEDSSLKSDIEHNIAFLIVGIKLLDPDFSYPEGEKVRQLVDHDLKAVASGRPSHSATAGRQVDFSNFKPFGWYRASKELERFFRAKQWVSRIDYPIMDQPSVDTTGGNSFRRSVLLYRNLAMAKVNDQPAYVTWMGLERAWQLLGSPVSDWQDRTLSPENYKIVFKGATGSLDRALSRLADPLFRTKLMLSVRKQKPVTLSSASIFELSGKGAGKRNEASFQLFPTTGDPELPWLRKVSSFSQGRAENGEAWPLGLLVLNARGAGQASNVLYQSAYKIDPKIARYFPSLARSVLEPTASGQLKPRDDRRWKILTGYFSLLPQGAQGVLRTDMWQSRKLESAFAGWLDSTLALAPPVSEPGTAPETPTLNDKATGRRPAFHHFLEPTANIYKQIRQDAQDLQTELKALGYYSNKYDRRFSDFTRLCERLEKISELELTGRALPMSDLKLLGNIDMVLENVVVPMAGSVSLSPPVDSESRQGVNLALGQPGLLYIILQRGQRTRLARGAVYSYYQVPGHPLRSELWEHRLAVGRVTTPYWTDEFDIVQKVPPRKLY